MNWLTNFVKPKLSSLVKRKSVPEKLWNNCVACGNMIHHKDLNDNLRVCMNCDYHFRMSAEDRIKLFFKKDEYFEIELDKILSESSNPKSDIIFPAASFLLSCSSDAIS